MKKIIKNKKGFTLVELLVVISIIAILSVVGLTLFNNVQLNARDARRKADVDAIVSALEVKRDPGTIYYKAIVDADLSSGSIPQDSVNGNAKYCIKVYTADNGAQEANPTTSDWAPAGTPPVDPVCPTGFNQATVALGFNATNFAANTKNSFKLCARLEGGGGSVYCKNSAQ